MFTTSRLEQKLSAWSEKFKTARLPPSPIQLYQAYFAFFHDLKNSMYLSTDASIVALVPTIERIDEQLRPLAYGQVELRPNDNENLLKLAAALTALESVGILLAPALPHAIKLPELDPVARFSRAFGWDVLSRARATSAVHHGYTFMERSGLVALSALMDHDAALEAELAALEAMPIARALTPKPQGKDLSIEIRQLAAVPPKGLVPSGWAQLSG